MPDCPTTGSPPGPDPDSSEAVPETSQAPLIQLPPPADLSEPCDDSLSTTPATALQQRAPPPAAHASAPAAAAAAALDSTGAAAYSPASTELDHHSDMAESSSSLHSDASSSSSDYGSDAESIFEIPCLKAHTVRFLQPGKPSVVDLMRAEKPTFKRASQMVMRRPMERPFISPIQPPKRYKRSPSPTESASSKASFDGPGKSDSSSVPTTPTLDDDDDDDSSSSPTSDDGSPSTPETPKSSFEHEPRLNFKATSDGQITGLKSRVKVPSRLNLFPKRSTSMNVSIEQKDPGMSHATAHETTTTTRSTPTRFTMLAGRTPRDANAREPAFRLPPSPVEQLPPTAKQLPTPRTGWRETGKAKLFGGRMRRMESRVGLNGH